MIKEKLLIKMFQNAEYEETHERMLALTLDRIAKKKQGIATPDELWIVEHQDVYTLGQAGKEEHILGRSDTPIIKTDRGGQVTWHGKGQLVMYWLFDLTALNWKVRDLVSHAEQAIEDVINFYLFGDLIKPSMTHTDFFAKARQDAPGVYVYKYIQTANLESSSVSIESDQPKVDLADYEMLGKIASLGFKIKQGFSYHGIAINVTCDLTPFSLINPCGYAGMQMVRLSDYMNHDVVDINLELTTEVTDMLIRNIALRHSNITLLRK